jgi:hypothetical protein
VNALLIAAELPDLGAAVAGLLRDAGADVELAAVAEPAGRDELDPVLQKVGGRRLVFAGSLAAAGDLAVRLLRRNELDTPIGLVLTDTAADPPTGVAADALTGSASGRFAGRIGLPTDLVAAARVAATGTPRKVDVLRDDAGRVVLDTATLASFQGGRLRLRGYVDDTCVADGDIGRLTVTATGGGRLHATAAPFRRWRRAVSAAGRAVQVGCDEARLTVDGRPHPRPVTRRTWWVEPAVLRVAVPE